MLKFTLFIITYAYAVGAKNLENELMGISTEKFREHFEKAVLGFRDTILNGDPDLGYPKMEPYSIDHHWEYSDETTKLECFLENITITGLSDYEINHVAADPRYLFFGMSLKFENIQLQGSYKLNGYVFNNWLPVFGDDHFRLNTGVLYFNTYVDLDLQQSQIVIDKVDANYFFNTIYPPYFQVDVENLMDLPAEFSGREVYNILMKIYNPFKRSSRESMSKQIKKLIEEKISGKPLYELLELMDYFAKKNVSS